MTDDPTENDGVTEHADQPEASGTPDLSEIPDTCGDTRTAPDGRALECRRPFNHDEDHFDDLAGIAWLNIGHDTAGMTQEERVHAVLDRIGVPRFRDGIEGAPPAVFTLVQRTNLFIDRIGKRLHTQVENNMVYYTTVKEALLLLKGAPHSGEFRTKSAIKKLEAVMPVRRTPSGLHLN
jgi:hypothetical protein